MNLKNARESKNYTIDEYDPSVYGFPYKPGVDYNLTNHERNQLANGMQLGDILFIRLIKSGKIQDPDSIPMYRK